MPSTCDCEPPSQWSGGLPIDRWHTVIVETRRPILIFDGDCAFCTRSVRALERWVRHRPTIEAWQRLDLDSLGVGRDECEAAVQWIAADGTRASGHHAVARTLIHGGKGWAVLGRFLLLPGVSWLAGRVYAWVARNRHRMPGGTAECALPADERASTGGGSS